MTEILEHHPNVIFLAKEPFIQPGLYLIAQRLDRHSGECSQKERNEEYLVADNKMKKVQGEKNDEKVNNADRGGKQGIQ